MRKIFEAMATKVLELLGYHISKKPKKDFENRIDVIENSEIWNKLISFQPVEFAKVFSQNRKIQKEVKIWFSKEVGENSMWQYGIPKKEYIRQLHMINRNITYTDLLCFLCQKLETTNYLEIGVSAGKNFYLISKILSESKIFGMDIEAFNPFIEKLFTDKIDLWESTEKYNFRAFNGIEKKLKYTLKMYTEKGKNNQIYYLRGDKFNREVWNVLQGEKFNIIFSDACHKPESLATEFDFLNQFKLIDLKEFIMLWDDLTTPKMIESFIQIVGKLKTLFIAQNPHAALIDIHGTYGGDNQGIHKVGLFISDKKLIEKTALTPPM